MALAGHSPASLHKQLSGYIMKPPKQSPHPPHTTPSCSHSAPWSPISLQASRTALYSLCTEQ